MIRLAMRLSRCAGLSPGTGRCEGVARGRRPDGCSPAPSNLSDLPKEPYLPRKEVIQPHVPVRLPCYDFTPLTPHTFDASPPRGLGRRLRVQATRVV